MENAEKTGGIHKYIKAELLAPAGNLDTLICAVNAGADAVYAGGNMFSARAYAANFSEEDLIKGIKYAHLHGAKVHLAVNTLFKNTETSVLFDYLRPYVISGLDAVIVQDIGVMSLLRREYPGLEIHASTQCTVTDINGVRFFADMGVKRVVPARELCLQEIATLTKEAHSLGLEIEVFIHGALCYSYSGQCLMSSVIGGRSGNRGRCAQPCRLPYEVCGETVYPLSLKDYNGAYNLDKLLDTGVDSLKIEGRMKSPDYVYGVTEIYRRLIDEYIDSGKKPEKKDIEALDELGQRGGNTPGYPIMRNGREMVSLHDASHRSGETGKADTGIKRLSIEGQLDIECGNPMRLCLYSGDKSVSVTGGVVQPAVKAPVDESFIRDKISAMGNTFFSLEKLDINMPGEPVFISAKELKELKREAVAELEDRLLYGVVSADDEDSAVDACGFKQVLTDINTIHINCNHRNLPQDMQKHIVAESLSQVETALDMAKADIIFICTFAMKEAEVEKAAALIKEAGATVGIAFPFVFREKNVGVETLTFEEEIAKYAAMGAEYYLVRNYSGIDRLLSAGVDAVRIFSDHSVYTWNNEAIEGLRRLGLKHFTAPLELNAQELAHRDNSDSAIVVSALYPLMVTAGCIQNTMKGCSGTNAVYFLKDRMGKTFKARSYCNECMNVIYNSLPTDLSGQMGKIQELGFEAVRYDLCGMDEDIMKAVFAGELTGTTGGHFKRGVQ